MISFHHNLTVNKAKENYVDRHIKFMSDILNIFSLNIEQNPSYSLIWVKALKHVNNLTVLL